MKRVCAVIVTYNRKELLRECLYGVLSQSRRPDHVLVVDNASTDGTTEMLRNDFPQVEILALPQNQGSAGGFHEGIKHAYDQGYDWIWVMDDDTVPTASSLEELLNAAQCLNEATVKCHAIGSKVLWTDGRPHPMNTPWLKPFSRVTKCSTQEASLISFASIMINRKAIAERGLPRKEFFIWNDDWEYFLRLGYVFFAPRSIVIHKTKTRHTTDYNSERYYYQARNRLWIVRTKGIPLFWRLLLFLHFAGEALVYLRKQGLQGWRTILRGLKDGLKPLPW